ncbi:MAG TPA: ABC transporter permease subunit [Clostridia bacterium]
MISKPLFKQSCKANAGIWLFVTAITCAMLIITILVLGNLNVDEIRTSMTDMFIKDAVESTVEKSSMTYYDMTETALESYETIYNQLNSSINDIISNYNELIKMDIEDAVARQTIKEKLGLSDEQFEPINDLLDIYIQKGALASTDVSNYVLNKIADGVYSQLLSEQGEEIAEAAKEFIAAAISAFIQSEENNVTEFATNYIPSVVSDVYYQQSFDYNDQKIYISNYFTKEKLTNISYSAIISFRAEMDFKKSRLIESGLSDEEITKELAAYKQTIIEDKSKTMFFSLPEKVTKALTELGSMDVFELVIGSMFYRIAGLLLPMIFVIMTANNLIAGQVDSGAMAYVLSTPTKRRKVTVTQMCYLIAALFAMFALTTITSVVCLMFVKEMSISYAEMLLLNLGAFITMFAVSGICFLASSWFNRSKLSMSFGGGLSMFFLVATILGLFGSNVIPSAIRIEAMKYFNYVSVISLFDAISIMGGTLTFLWKFAILLAIGAAAYAIGIIKFDKKDLPL